MKTVKYLEHFKVPEVAFKVIDKIVSPQEIILLETLAKDNFTIEDAKEALSKNSDKDWSHQEVKELLLSAYKRGVIELEDDSYELYKIGSFYSRLDIFAIAEEPSWLLIPKSMRTKINDWYFETYLSRLDGSALAPTLDKVATLGEAKEHIDSFKGQIWLNKCDCRTLAGDCNNITEVCISFRNGLNTFSHRGLSTPISQEEAKAVLEKADASGLMHTLNPGGICNCCGDCCYLFRAQKALGSNKTWPRVEWIAELDKNICIGCGLCTERCHFDAFKLKEGEVEYDSEKCRGCGLCKETCPAGAIELVKRG